MEQKSKGWNIFLLCNEKDCEFYSKKLDACDDITNYKSSSLTLYEFDQFYNKNDSKVVCLSYTSKLNLIKKNGESEKQKIYILPCGFII